MATRGGRGELRDLTPFTGAALSGAPQRVPIGDLRFDLRNPRLGELAAEASQDQVLERLWRDFAVEDLALSIAVGGFFPHEPLIVEPEDGALLVVDGNRRLAAARVLTEPILRERLDAGRLPALGESQAAALQELPVLPARRRVVWQSLGYRHVGGEQPWRSHAEALYVAWVHDEVGVPLDRVAAGVGDEVVGVRRLYRALTILRQAEEAGVYRLDDRWTSHLPFSLLVDALGGAEVRRFIGLAEDRPTVPDGALRELGELLGWLFGSRSRQLAPVIGGGDPDVRLLDRVVGDPVALAALRHGRSLAEAAGADRLAEHQFREAMREARRHLQEAHGSLPPGGAGQPDLRRYVDDLAVLIQAIRDDLQGDGPIGQVLT